MKITVLGAAQEVTGSCYLVEASGMRLLIDCGLFQGSRRLERYNYIPEELTKAKLDFVLLTHGHLDHCGRLPLLFKRIRACPILCTSATADVAELVLRDAAKIQQDDADRENRKRRRREKQVSPLFTEGDVERVGQCFRHVLYDDWIQLGDAIRVRYLEAGHIIGSASIELEVNESGTRRRVVFSGDLGPAHPLLQRAPAIVSSADAVFIETTYGDRDHRSLESTWQEFTELARSAVERRGKILIPTFAVGRAQQILYYFSELFHRGIVAPFPIYLDSPMAIAATEIYIKHHRLLRDDVDFLDGQNRLHCELPTLTPCQTAEESMALNHVEGPCAILAGAGMCNAGRILHHLRHGLGAPENVVIIAGYQAKGSTGRQIIEGAKEVKIFKETVKVRATVRGLGGFSAHAGQTDLLNWLSPLTTKQAVKPLVVLTHGESNAMIEFAFKAKELLDINCHMPRLTESVLLAADHPQDGYRLSQTVI